MEIKRPKEELEELLTDPSKKSYSTPHHLLRIWREFLSAEQVTQAKWTRLVMEHINKLKRIKPMSAQDIGTARGNLVKLFIAKPSMSFGALLRGLEFLGYSSVRIQITGIRPDGTEVTNSATIPIAKRRMFGEAATPTPEESTTSDSSEDVKEVK
ncbi:hypothetical protein ACSA002_1490 [Salmonella phage vB_SalM_SA002]|nr:hypothetical protein ACSA002_1490 [Salmonella phage vB_SalM_SA002]